MRTRTDEHLRAEVEHAVAKLIRSGGSPVRDADGRVNVGATMVKALMQRRCARTPTWGELIACASRLNPSPRDADLLEKPKGVRGPKHRITFLQSRIEGRRKLLDTAQRLFAVELATRLRESGSHTRGSITVQVHRALRALFGRNALSLSTIRRLELERI